jgi:hypothetical protein
MNKRGVSPLIVSVLLVGLTFVVGIVVIGFGTDIQKLSIENQETDLEVLGWVQFSAYYKDASCTPEANHHCYRLLIVNNEDLPINFIVKTNSLLGKEISGPDEYFLGPYEQKVFNINYSSSLGNESVFAEVDPVVKKE